MEDQNLNFSADAGDDMTASAAGELFSLSIPLAVMRNISAGTKKMFVEIIVKTALSGAGDTLDIDLGYSDDAAGVTNAVWFAPTLLQIPAAAAIGTKLSAQIPDSLYNSATFLQEGSAAGANLILRGYARGNGAPNTGKVFAHLTLEPGFHNVYPSKTTV